MKTPTKFEVVIQRNGQTVERVKHSEEDIDTEIFEDLYDDFYETVNRLVENTLPEEIYDNISLNSLNILDEFFRDEYMTSMSLTCGEWSIDVKKWFE